MIRRLDAAVAGSVVQVAHRALVVLKTPDVQLEALVEPALRRQRVAPAEVQFSIPRDKSAIGAHQRIRRHLHERRVIILAQLLDALRQRLLKHVRCLFVVSHVAIHKGHVDLRHCRLLLCRPVQISQHSVRPFKRAQRLFVLPNHHARTPKLVDGHAEMRIRPLGFLVEERLQLLHAQPEVHVRTLMVVDVHLELAPVKVKRCIHSL